MFVVASGRNAPAPAVVVAASPAAVDVEGEQRDLSCEELCELAEGLGADSCITECRTHTDVAPGKEESLGDFVEDKSYNEPSGKGGEAMEDVYEENYGNDTIADCVPDPEIADSDATFEDVDDNADGVVTADEAVAFGERMCVSDEMTTQIFHMADANQDGELTPEEYDAVGEESAAEEAMDKAADSVSEGDQEYSEVKPPQFEEFDKDGDGVLNEDEVAEAVMFELSRRFPGKSEEELHEIAGEMYANGELKFLGDLDTDGDGVVSKEEWEAPEGGKPEDLGSEIAESASADENAEDPDDLPTAEQSEPPQAPAPAAVAFHARAAPSTGGPWRSLFLRALHAQHGRGAAAHRGAAHGLRLRPAAHLVGFRRQPHASERTSRGEGRRFWQGFHTRPARGAKTHRGSVHELRMQQALRSQARHNLLARAGRRLRRYHSRQA